MTIVAADTPTEPQLFSGPPRYEASTPWGPWGALGATVLIFLGQIVGVTLVVFGYMALYGVADLKANITPDKLMSLATPLGITTALASQISSLVVLWMLAGRQGRRGDTLKLNPPYPTWATCVAGGLIIVALTGVVEFVLYQLLHEDMFTDTKFLADGLGSHWWFGTMVMGVVLAPLWEELTFRGFLLSALAQTRLGFWGAALICNILWTGLHAQYGAAGIASVFTSGLVLSWLLWRTGSIRAPVVAHGIANLVAVIFAYTFNPAVHSAVT